jgi:hypothetical protein
MQQMTVSSSTCLPFAAATEPVGGVPPVPINPDHKHSPERDLWKKRKPSSPSERQPTPTHGESPHDSGGHVDDYA